MRFGFLKKKRKEKISEGPPTKDTIKTSESDEEYIFKYSISPDDMEATMSFNPPPSRERIPAGYLKDPTEAVDELIYVLKNKGIAHGVDFNNLNTAVEKIQNFESFKDLVIARGDELIEGEDTRLDIKIDMSVSTGRVDDDTGHIDYRDRGTIKTVREGELLALLVPCTIGQDKKTVTGKVTNAKKGVEKTYKAGKNVYIEEDEEGRKRFVSKIQGSPIFQEHFIDVTPETLINGDVDYSTGNINCHGDLKILGKVSPGFTVESEGDIEIFDYVEGATVKSKGNVTLKRGIKGQDKGVVETSGNVYATYIERAKIISKGDVVVNNILLDSNVVCGGKVIVTSGKGSIIGGNVKAAQGIEAKRIGSDFSTSTSLHVGRNFFLEEKTLDVDEYIKRCNKQIAEIERYFPVTVLNGENIAIIGEDKKEMATRASALWERLKEIIDEAAKVKNKMDESLKTGLKSTISVREMIYPRVRIAAGGSRMLTEKEHKNVVFYEDAQNHEVKYRFR